MAAGVEQPSLFAKDEKITLAPTLDQGYKRIHDKGIFIDSLISTVVETIEVIWPMVSATSSRNRRVLPLRDFICELLRRARISYSTLQVALYYLILIKKHVDSKIDEEDDRFPRVLLCGRRVFFGILILASKYLQDRNYSARAWSKISGLRVQEIAENEVVILETLGWNIHVPKSVADKWNELLLRSIGSTSQDVAERRASTA